MAEFVEQAGLLLPKAKDKPEKREYGVLEIRDPEKRKEASRALVALWNCMELFKGSEKHGIEILNDRPDYEVGSLLWETFGKAILGKDVPDCEEWS